MDVVDDVPVKDSVTGPPIPVSDNAAPDMGEKPNDI